MVARARGVVARFVADLPTQASLLRPGSHPPGLRRRALVFAYVALVAMSVAGVCVWHIARGLPDLEPLRDYRPEQTTRVLDREGRLIGEWFKTRRTVVPLERIPLVLRASVLAAEDAEFYDHHGVDLPGIGRIVFKALRDGRITQGASTITQQVVKNVLLTPERTLSRKVRELILARRVERTLSKDQILHVYLNHINFGHGRYGVQEAARFYFGKDVQELSLGEASMLAGIPQAPGRLSPLEHPEAARRRQRFVLDQLEDKRDHWPDISVAAIRDAREHAPALRPGDDRGQWTPEVMAQARHALAEAVGTSAAERVGYTVHTSLDLDVQASTRRALQKGLRGYDGRHGLRVPLRRQRRYNERRLAELEASVRTPAGDTHLDWSRSYSAVVLGVDARTESLSLAVDGERAHLPASALARHNPDHLPLVELAEPGAVLRVGLSRNRPGEPALVAPRLGPEGAICVLDVNSREVLALVGGYRAEVGFNRATQALRQPASAFKPILYALALRSRLFTPASLVFDTPLITHDGWAPSNFEADHDGPVRLRTALARSINRAAVRVINRVGPAQLVDFARKLGITSELPAVRGLSLGVAEVHLHELTNAYATLADGGRHQTMGFVRGIVAADGSSVPLVRAHAQQALTPAEAYVSTSLMQSVVTEGTARRALRLRRPVAGKTGTSNDARDAWFVGYTPELVAGVWVGYDDHRPMGDDEGGRETALPIWIDVMRELTADEPETDFHMPEGVVRARIDPVSGLRAYAGMPDAMDEVFLEGTTPARRLAAAFWHVSDRP